MWWSKKTESNSSGYPVDWNRRRSTVFKQDNWVCQSCGRVGGSRGSAELHAHHVVPKSHGGGHELDNLTTVCDRCHAEIHDDKRLFSNQTTQTSSWKGHVTVAVLTGWWTLGIGNLLYERYRRNKSVKNDSHRKERKEGVKQLKQEARSRKRDKNTASQGKWHTEVNAGYNKKFDGCHSCGRNSLTVRWEARGDRRKKVIECESCDTLYEEQIIERELQLQSISDEKQTRTEQSALAYELNKHLTLGTIDKADLPELKDKLLREAETNKEEQHIKSKFKEYGR